LSAANSRFSKTHTRAAHFWQPLPTAGLQPAPDQEGNSAEFGDIPSTPALCPSDCFVTQPSSFSNSSSTFLQLLFRFYVVFASSLRTRRSKSVLSLPPPSGRGLDFIAKKIGISVFRDSPRQTQCWRFQFLFLNKSLMSS
jgi:hypothetical protein